jgi:hypothetical protein
MTDVSVEEDLQIILTVRSRLETLDHVAPAAEALYGAGILKLFDDGELVRVPPALAAEVTCGKSQGGYAKLGFYSAGFDVQTSTEPAPAPAPSNVVTVTVKPSLADTIKNYPIGAAESGMIAAKALCGAHVTQPIGANSDPCEGDPATSMQVSCYGSDVARVQSAFRAAFFTAVQD